MDVRNIYEGNPDQRVWQAGPPFQTSPAPFLMIQMVEFPTSCALHKSVRVSSASGPALIWIAKGDNDAYLHRVPSGEREVERERQAARLTHIFSNGPLITRCWCIDCVQS